MSPFFLGFFQLVARPKLYQIVPLNFSHKATVSFYIDFYGYFMAIFCHFSEHDNFCFLKWKHTKLCGVVAPGNTSK